MKVKKAAIWKLHSKKFLNIQYLNSRDRFWHPLGFSGYWSAEPSCHMQQSLSLNLKHIGCRRLHSAEDGAVACRQPAGGSAGFWFWAVCVTLPARTAAAAAAPTRPPTCWDSRLPSSWRTPPSCCRGYTRWPAPGQPAFSPSQEVRKTDSLWRNRRIKKFYIFLAK